MTERQTDITPEETDYEPPSDDELRGGTTEIDDEPPVGAQPGIPENGEPPASE